jgi:hypothetical protein
MDYKITGKYFLYSFVMLILLYLSGCSSDDKTPPKAGFKLSDEFPIQWDEVMLSNQSSDAAATAYQISGGEFELKDDLSSIVFLEDHTYTITQVVSNDHGEDSYSLTVDVTGPDNAYFIDENKIPILKEPDWEKESKKVQIRFINEVAGQQYPDFMDLFPIPGSNPLEATYLFDNAGKITGTYLMRIIKDYNADLGTYEWTMDFSGNDGDGKLVIDLVYEDRLNPEDNVYDISIETYTLSTGRFDFPSGEGFIEEAKRSFSVYYRGKMKPVE